MKILSIFDPAAFIRHGGVPVAPDLGCKSLVGVIVTQQLLAIAGVLLFEIAKPLLFLLLVGVKATGDGSTALCALRLGTQPG